MYQVGRVPDHVHRSHKEHNRWMCVPEVREPFSIVKLMHILLTAFAVGAFMFALCVIIAMFVQM